MSTISSFKSIKNKHDLDRDKHCMKKFCESLERARNEDKICTEKFETKYLKEKK